MNHEIPDVQTGHLLPFRTRDQIANICWIMEKARQFQKNIYFCFALKRFMIMLAEHLYLAFSSDSYVIEFNFPSVIFMTQIITTV